MHEGCLEESAFLVSSQMLNTVWETQPRAIGNSEAQAMFYSLCLVKAWHIGRAE